MVAATSASSFALSKGRGKGHRLLALKFAAIADTNTFDTGLDHVDSVSYMQIGTAAAANVLTMRVIADAGTIDFGMATLAAAHIIVIGSVRGHA